MRPLSFSNIAWDSVQDEAVVEILCENGFNSIEIAPTKIWPDLARLTSSDIHATKLIWESRGLPIIAMQSLLFGQPDLQLFGSTDSRQRLINHLKKMIEVGSALGSKILVFGSPQNRARGALDVEVAQEIAVSVFSHLGEYAEGLGIFFCIEPNAKIYGCDFITNSSEAFDLVNVVNSKGFGLHLDLACMQLEKENITQVLSTCSSQIRHFHLSAPFLRPVKFSSTEAQDFMKLTDILDSKVAISVEMKSANRAVETLKNLSITCESIGSVFKA